MLTLSPLSPSTVVFNPCYYPIKENLLETKCVFKHEDLKIVGLKLNKYE